KEFTKEYEVKAQSKILVINQNAGSLHKIKIPLVNAGFQVDNIYFAISEGVLPIESPDVIIFNDYIASSLSQDEMEDFIRNEKERVNKYLYYGQNTIPLKDWKEQYSIKLSASGMENTLISNLMRLLKEA
ncbi:MAG: NARF domain-containing protein, partial [Bacteroidota bacterium]